MTHPIPAIARIALAELLARHRHEVQEAMQAAHAVSGLPAGEYDMNLDKGVWIARGGTEEPADA